MKFGSKTRFLVFLNFGLIVLDRLTKWFISENPDFYLGRFIELKLFRNTNLYFISLSPYANNLLKGVIGAVLLVLIFLFFKTLKQERFLLTLGFSLIILAGLSNLFDRLYFGYVIDWIRVFILPISIFNIADMMIIGGITCLIFHLIKSR